jgi:hypothetical protein
MDRKYYECCKDVSLFSDSNSVVILDFAVFDFLRHKFYNP